MNTLIILKLTSLNYKSKTIVLQVPAHGLVFHVQTNSTSECGLEKQYNLFTHNEIMYFAGFNGQHFVRFENKQWTIFKINFQTDEQEVIGFIQKEIEYPRIELTNIIGYHVMNCYISEKNETVAELFKFVNVSKILSED